MFNFFTALNNELIIKLSGHLGFLLKDTMWINLLLLYRILITDTELRYCYWILLIHLSHPGS